MDFQTKMNKAFENYLSLSNELISDGEYLLSLDENDIRWQRNFIRTVVSIIEGYSHCFRQIAVIGVKMGAGELTKKEEDVLLNEENYRICDRIKLTLRSTYKMLSIKPLPDFGTKDWSSARFALKKRNSLTHPKTIMDLEITEETWGQIHDGLTWLFEQHANLVKFIYERHSKESN